MNQRQKAQFIQKTLDFYFPHPEIPLKHTSAFTLLVAVVLSARSTDAKVNEITPLLFKKAKTPQQMASLTIAQIREIIKPIGLSPQKAKALHQLSHILIEKFQGKVPKTFEELESLPGVGHKTASVVMAQVFHIPAFPVDTHIFRCARRWKLSKGNSVAKVEEDLKKLFPKSSWIKLHLQIIYFARRYCTAKKHHIPDCPICSEI
jgi:endonuclease III